jgi:hypothetical protein
MKYKAKKSYKALPYAENFCGFGSGSKHLKLMAGEWVECNPPAKLKEHLEPKIKKAEKHDGN